MLQNNDLTWFKFYQGILKRLFAPEGLNHGDLVSGTGDNVFRGFGKLNIRVVMAPDHFWCLGKQTQCNQSKEPGQHVTRFSVDKIDRAGLFCRDTHTHSDTVEVADRKNDQSKRKRVSCCFAGATHQRMLKEKPLHYRMPLHYRVLRVQSGTVCHSTILETKDDKFFLHMLNTLFFALATDWEVGIFTLVFFGENNTEVCTLLLGCVWTVVKVGHWRESSSGLIQRRVPSLWAIFVIVERESIQGKRPSLISLILKQRLLQLNLKSWAPFGPN